MRKMIAAIMVAWAVPAAAYAEPSLPCPSGSTVLPAELSGWSSRTVIAAAANAADSDRARLEPKVARDATLIESSKVRFPVPPGKLASSETYGGILRFSVEADGVYRVALGAGAWVDVLREGKVIASSAHGHGPACSGIRKIVDFRLSAGEHFLQIAGSPTPVLAVLVAPRARFAD